MNNPFYYTWTKQSSAFSYSLKESKGSYITLESGQEILDFCSSSYQMAFGHTPDFIIRRVKDQLESLPMANPKANYHLKEQVTKSLLTYMGLGSGKVFYTLSGAESIENALKMARQISGKQIVLCRTPSYHGATLGALSVTGDWRNKEHITQDAWVERIPEPSEDTDLKKTRELINKIGPENISAFCLETITGNNGVLIQDQTWWDGIQSLCKEFDIFLILDEVTCGFGRTGKPFAYQHYKLKPDFVCLAKAITGGVVPFGAVWTSAEVANYYEDHILSCGLTNYAHPLGLAAMEAVLYKLQDEKFTQDYQALEAVFHDQLSVIKKLSLVKEIRFQGMLAAVDLTPHSFKLDDFFHSGLYLVCQAERLILAPALNMSVDDLKKGFQIIVGIMESP